MGWVNPYLIGIVVMRRALKSKSDQKVGYRKSINTALPALVPFAGLLLNSQHASYVVGASATTPCPSPQRVRYSETPGRFTFLSERAPAHRLTGMDMGHTWVAPRQGQDAWRRVMRRPPFSGCGPHERNASRSRQVRDVS